MTNLSSHAASHLPENSRPQGCGLQSPFLCDPVEVPGLCVQIWDSGQALALSGPQFHTSVKGGGGSACCLPSGAEVGAKEPGASILLGRLRPERPRALLRSHSAVGTMRPL